MSTSVPLQQALTETQARAEALLGEIKVTEEKLSKLKQDLREAQLDERVLLRVVNRFGGPVADEPEPEQASTEAVAFAENDWSWKSRTDAVHEAVTALSEVDGFATPGTILDYLAARNRDESRDNIGAALSYLRKAERVQSHERAQWVPLEQPSVPTVVQVLFGEE